MRKKIFAVALLFVAMMATLVGCGKNTFALVKENMSEWTKVYFMGENEAFYATLSSGEREEKYKMNGESLDCVPFALLSVHFNESPKTNVIKISLDIDGTKKEESLEINTLNDCYMIDLGTELSGNEQISLQYGVTVLQLECVSKDFQINDTKAMEIGCKELEKEILKKKSFGHLNAEIYLRVLDKKANNFEDQFWCFTVLNIDNESFSVIISTVDGSILAKTK